jgi:peptide/nickel transport system substrate-binding protein
VRTFKLLAAATLMMGTAMAGPALSQSKLDIAIIGEPQSLDPMMSTQDVVSIVTQHFVETLYTFDSSWNVAPLLAEALPEIAADGKTYRIRLRDGITFHDGSPMDSADVVASLERWKTQSTRGKGVADRIAAITAVDPLTVEISLTEPYSPLLSLLAFSNSAAAVYPQEILGETLSAIVGTGPYRLVEHLPDQYIQLARFDAYVSRSEPSDGTAGARAAIADELRFVPVPDPNTRVEGLLSGQFDYADGLPVEAYDRIAASDARGPGAA